MAEDKIWKKRFLVPLWVPQIIVCIVIIGASAFALYAVGQAAADGDFSGYSVSQIIAAVNIGAALSLALAVFTILMDMYEMILMAKGKLKPGASLAMQCIKSGIWAIWLVLNVAAAARGEGSGLSIFLALVLFVTSTAQLTYASIIFHRSRKVARQKGDYALAEGGQLNAKPYNAVYQQPTYTAYKPPRDDFEEDDEAEYKHTAGARNYYGAGGMTFELHNGQEKY